MKYASIILVHYGQADDFGEKRSRVNRSDLMKIGLQSLKENTDYPAEIIVMDNGGNPDDSDWLVQKQREGWIDTYVRFKSNMNFAFAFNQGFRLATGDYVCFTCNDIEFKKGWLSTCVGLLEKYSDRKLIASPIITPEKDNWHYNKEVLPDGARVNSLAGSNCFILTPEAFREIGDVPHHRVGGSIWHRRMNSLGYKVIVPPVNMINHLAFKGGTDFRKATDIHRILLNGEKVEYNYKYTDPAVDYLDGKQRSPGMKI